ncbi:MAG TPA: arylamine N-acetyltransferase [Burkholderiaceae bacterium]
MSLGTLIDLDAYRRRIADEGPLTPTLATLARFVKRHAETIPFENIDVLAGRVPRLDPASLQAKLVQQRRGGYCFEQNGLFLAVLRQIGFVVRGLEARVRSGVPAEVVTARTHMALSVTLEGVAHHADVGFGALAPTAPLRAAERGAQRDGVDAYRFTEAGVDRMLQIQTPDGWSDCYRIGPTEPAPIDYEVGNWFVATYPSAMLRHNLLMGRAVPGGRLALFNRTLTLRRGVAQPLEQRLLTTRAEFAAVFAEDFGLEIAAADLEAVMAVIERQAAPVPAAAR